MLNTVQLALKKELTRLVGRKAELENEIKAVSSALALLGARKGSPLARRALRSPMSAAERRSVSKRMKAYWAKRRAKKTH